jgi:hypothetical protein
MQGAMQPGTRLLMLLFAASNSICTQWEQRIHHAPSFIF